MKSIINKLSITEISLRSDPIRHVFFARLFAPCAFAIKFRTMKKDFEILEYI